MEARGKGLRREDYYSICSCHPITDWSCPTCQRGRWVNHWAQLAGNIFYALCPWGWRIWANRPKSPGRKFLESVFPKLRGAGMPEHKPDAAAVRVDASEGKGMTREEAEQHALHICRTMGVDDETALLGGLPDYLLYMVEQEKADKDQRPRGHSPEVALKGPRYMSTGDGQRREGREGGEGEDIRGSG